MRRHITRGQVAAGTLTGELDLSESKRWLCMPSGYYIYVYIERDTQNDTKGINNNMGTQLPVTIVNHFNHFFVFQAEPEP